MLALTLPRSKEPFARNHLLRDAIGQATYDAMVEDKAVHLFGEGCEPKQHYDAPYILEEFPNRVVTTPIAEDGGINFCVGASLLGIKPVYDVIAGDFLFRAMDSICNTAAKLGFVRGQEPTIVIRAEFLTGGPTTGQRPEALFTHIPGLRVAIPSTPRDAYGLMRTALETPGVTLLLEDRMIDDEGPWEPEDLELGATVPFGKATIREGGLRGQPLVLTYGVMRQVVERALLDLPGPRVIDLCSLYPLDWDTLRWNLRGRHNKVLIVEPDVTYGGVGAEIAATLAEEFVGVEIKRLGAPRGVIPAASALHAKMLPTEEEILHALSPW